MNKPDQLLEIGGALSEVGSAMADLVVVMEGKPNVDLSPLVDAIKAFASALATPAPIHNHVQPTEVVVHVSANQVKRIRFEYDHMGRVEAANLIRDAG